jgi:hypothetical protein
MMKSLKNSILDRTWQRVITSFAHEMKVQGEVVDCVETLENQGVSAGRTLIMDCLSVKE